MIGRYAYLAVVALGVFAIVKAPADRGTAMAAVTQTCSAATPGAATVTFVWGPLPEDAREVWLDTSEDGGFADGRFTGHGPLPAGQSVYAIDGVPEGEQQYRLNARYDDGWRVVASGSFVARCDRPASPSIVATARGVVVRLLRD